jgi:hypothetical protein
MSGLSRFRDFSDGAPRNHLVRIGSHGQYDRNVASCETTL